MVGAVECFLPSFSFQAMEEELSKEGFSLVQTENELRGKSFLVDRHCPDVIFFPHHLIDYLEALPIVKKKALVIQVGRYVNYASPKILRGRKMNC